MKKFLFTLLLAGSGCLAYTQNLLQVNIGSGLCLDRVTVKFTDGNSSIFYLGCSGLYNLDIASREVSFVSVNGTPCYENETREVRVNNDTTATASRNVPRYIIKADGTVYDIVYDLNLQAVQEE